MSDTQVEPDRAVRASAEPEVPSGLSRLSKVLGAIVAPTTLFTGLLFYFGYMHAYWFYNYFGVDSTLLDLTNEDYLIRSLDGLFVPLAVTACVALLLLAAHELVKTRLGARPRTRVRRIFVLTLTIAGALLAFGGFLNIFVSTFLARFVVGAPLGLGVGVLLLVYVRHLTLAGQPGRRPGPPARTVVEWAGVFVLVGLSLFWAATDYSSAVGRSRARQYVTELPSVPNAVLYSTKSLTLSAPGVTETRCRTSGVAYPFRYDGLKLMLESGDQYVLLPADWTPDEGTAIVLPRNDSVRLEFRRPAAASRPLVC